jgi:hypothetical protein
MFYEAFIERFINNISAVMLYMLEKIEKKLLLLLT